ncbi:hypothetical protein [Salinarimonas rosea]|uniref:hypothetical protein n=1 Tax=Salinarimonas rosea TaxID=552063 RepID=UPI000429EDAC|nr:hypothetical protein [Salinarimonas rosea]
MSLRSAKQKHARIEAILDAAETYRVEGTPEWPKLAELSEETVVDSVRGNPDSVILKGDRFSGIMNIYVILKVHGDDPFEETDAFPARFEGHFEGPQAVIDTVDVSVRSFYVGTGIEPP